MQILTPDWPAPARVRACSTTRVGGVSAGPYASLNLGDHVGDDPARVARNRERLAAYLDLPGRPAWLRQVHGCDILRPGVEVSDKAADGSIAATPGEVCVVMTADCLPVLLCDERGTEVAAVHAGWRGLVNGVIESAVAAMAAEPEQLLVWLGPAIGPDAFEVGAEVRDQFLAADPTAAAAFRSSGTRWLADIFELARLRLKRLGIGRVYGGGDCTYAQSERFFSYRREGVTGRMASLIWISPQ
ncbi:peptidoglycan editing factor PgeF [Thiorhodococcus mannitoliphagus]|nr:peptidoglycan editing factor PgeF [Thiorhodococcus mannitoliphagus]